MVLLKSRGQNILLFKVIRRKVNKLLHLKPHTIVIVIRAYVNICLISEKRRYKMLLVIHVVKDDFNTKYDVLQSHHLKGNNETNITKYLFITLKGKKLSSDSVISNGNNKTQIVRYFKH